MGDPAAAVAAWLSVKVGCGAIDKEPSGMAIADSVGVIVEAAAAAAAAAAPTELPDCAASETAEPDGERAGDAESRKLLCGDADGV